LESQHHSIAHGRARLAPTPIQSNSTILPSNTDLLPEAHDLEALEVVQVPPLGGLLTLLGEVAVVELALDLLGLPLLLQGDGAGSAGELLENEAGERQNRERGGVAGDGGLNGGSGTLNKDLSCSR
jgi:hypothetical protein